MNRNASSSSQPFEVLENRQLFAVAVGFVAPSTLNFTGNFQADTVIINDNGFGTISGAVNNGAGVMVPFGPVPGIRNINVGTGLNNDRVYYTVMNDMPATLRNVAISLGEGHDSLRVNLANGIDIGPASIVNIRAAGGAGKDMLYGHYQGKLGGRLSMTFDGGSDDDRLFSDMRLNLGSTGSLFARTYGQDGNDTMDLLVHKANPADPAVVNAFASGGNGAMDRLRKTGIVPVFSDATVEFLSIVP